MPTWATSSRALISSSQSLLPHCQIFIMDHNAGKSHIFNGLYFLLNILLPDLFLSQRAFLRDAREKFSKFLSCCILFFFSDWLMRACWCCAAWFVDAAVLPPTSYPHIPTCCLLFCMTFTHAVNHRYSPLYSSRDRLNCCLLLTILSKWLYTRCSMVSPTRLFWSIGCSSSQDPFHYHIYT